MRPKFIAVLSLTALALVGCSAAETPAAPTPTQDVTITAETLAPPASAPASSDKADEEAFLAQLAYIRDAKGKLSGDLKKKASEAYQLKRGEKYCELLEDDPMTEPIYKNGKDATDLQIESNILMAAKVHLCPTAAN